MLKINITRLKSAVSLRIAGLCCLLCLAGCFEQAGSGSELDLAVDNAERQFQTQVNRPPTSKTLYTMADILSQQGRDTECEFVLKRIIREYPRYLPAYNSLAELQMRQGCIEDAIDTINDAFRISPDDPLLLNNMGICRIVRGEYEKALELFTRSACTETENTRYRMNLALALGLVARYEESLSLFKQVLPEEQANHNLSVLKELGKKAVSAADWQGSS